LSRQARRAGVGGVLTQGVAPSGAQAGLLALATRSGGEVTCTDFDSFKVE